MSFHIIEKKKTLPKRKTFICDICGKEREHGCSPPQPLYIQKEVGSAVITARVCNEHYSYGGSHFDWAKFTYTPELLALKFKIENKAKALQTLYLGRNQNENMS